MNVIKYLIRGFFLILWAALIYGFLLLPYAKSWFFADQKYICLYTWADRVDESLLKAFEQQTGIKVYVNHYESNEELLTKLEKMPFVDCDIIVPSGYIVDALVQSKLIKPIDKTQCHFLHRMYPEFSKTDSAVRNEYALALYWDVLGIGYDAHSIPAHDVSLNMIFNQNYWDTSHKKMGMIDDSRQSMVLAALYLQYGLQAFSSEQLAQMKDLLNHQKDWVGAYSDSQQGYYVASKTFPLVVSEREHICRSMQKHDFIAFKLPPEGALLTVDYIVVSASSAKDAMIYEFINYLYAHQIYKKNCEKFCLLPVCKDVYEVLDQRFIGVKDLVPGNNTFKKLKTFKNVLTAKQINDFWIQLKAM